MKFKFIVMFCLLTAAVCSFTVQANAATEGNWLTDYNQALEQAKKENKRVLIDFTGSDWCGWCIKLDKEVFSQKEFIDYADKNLVLLVVDFPRKKEQSATQKAANQKLAEQYHIEGFPTLIVLNNNGKQIGELGYEPGGPQAFIKSLKQIK